MPTPSPELISGAILRLTAAAGPAAAINPSDVAKELSPETWRSLLTSVRREAAKLATAGEIEILRKGKPVPVEALHGVVRFRQRAK